MPYWRLHYHIVWTTRNREPLIGSEEEAIIRNSIKLTCEDLDLMPHAIGVMPDHVHVVLSIPPKVSVADAVKRLKGASARGVNLRREVSHGDRFGWQAEYGALSFGDAALARVIAYVEGQAEHHAEMTTWSRLEQVERDR